MKSRLSVFAAASLLSISAFAEEAASKGPEVAFSGEVEFDAYTGDLLSDGELSHSYASTFDFNVDVKFNEKWSASVLLEADGETTDPAAAYSGAFIQYTKAEKQLLKLGDLTFSEGAFVNYYGYDDPADNAAGMSEHDIRGLEIDYNGIVFGLGFGRGDNDNQICVEGEEGEDPSCVNVAYDAHLAYELGLGEHTLRPFVDYKSYQEAKHNELHAGLDAALKFGAFALHAVYGLHADALSEDKPAATHAFLAEPSLEMGSINVKASVFYALFDDKNPTVHGEEIPEYFFAYAEPGISLMDALSVGVPLEYHSNTLDEDDDVSTFDAGVRLYFAPVEGLDITGIAMVKFPIGEKVENDDVSMTLGLETTYSF